VDLLPETIEPFIPAWGTPEEWNSACEKLESYLRAHEVNSLLHRAHITTLILRNVSLRWENQTPPAPISTLVIEETNRLLNEWFPLIMDLPEESRSAFTAADGRVALFLCDAPLRWPYAFLDPRPAPDDFKAAMSSSLLRSGPELQISNMVPRPIDLGLIPDLADDTMDVLNRIPLIKTLIGWLIFLAVLTYLFRITR
jgi:hypothetical protein